MTEYLIDLASYQHGINLAVVKAAGFTRVNIKLTQGNWYIDPYIREFVDGARANGMDISTFHWLDNKSSGAAQAQAHLAQMDKWGLREGTAHQCDCEDNSYPATWTIWRDYINAMQHALQRPVINYTGDWWWPAHMGTNNGAAVTPYLWAAPDHGYDAGYPGDGSTDWHADFGGWHDFSALQYAVAAIPGAGGGNLSLTAFRDHAIWPTLTGVDAASITTGGGDPMGAYRFMLNDAGPDGLNSTAVYLGTPGGGWYWARTEADFEGQNLAAIQNVGPFARAQAEHIFGPYRSWTPQVGPAGPKGDKGDTGDQGPKGDAAVLAPGATLTVA